MVPWDEIDDGIQITLQDTTLECFFDPNTNAEEEFHDYIINNLQQLEQNAYDLSHLVEDIKKAKQIQFIY